MSWRYWWILIHFWCQTSKENVTPIHFPVVPKCAFAHCPLARFHSTKHCLTIFNWCFPLPHYAHCEVMTFSKRQASNVMPLSSSTNCQASQMRGTAPFAPWDCYSLSPQKQLISPASYTIDGMEASLTKNKLWSSLHWCLNICKLMHL